MCCIRCECGKETFLVADVEELENLDASVIYARRLNAKEVLMPKTRAKFVFPVADETVKLVGRDQVFRKSTQSRNVLHEERSGPRWPCHVLPGGPAPGILDPASCHWPTLFFLPSTDPRPRIHQRESFLDDNPALRASLRRQSLQREQLFLKLQAHTQGERTNARGFQVGTLPGANGKGARSKTQR